jgi:hypothetical protein
MKSKLIITLLIVLFVSSCNLPGTQKSAGPAPEESEVSNSPEPTTNPPLENQIPLQANPDVSEGQGYVEFSLGSQTVRVNAADMMNVNTPDFTLTGQAPEGTVISANNQFALVGSEQNFAFPLSLVEGPNLIEIEASNSTGQTAAINLVLIFAPNP